MPHLHTLLKRPGKRGEGDQKGELEKVETEEEREHAEIKKKKMGISSQKDTKTRKSSYRSCLIMTKLSLIPYFLQFLPDVVKNKEIKVSFPPTRSSLPPILWLEGEKL